MLADEPTGNLDTASADEVFALMRTLDRVVELVDGRIHTDRARGDGRPRIKPPASRRGR